MLSNGKQMSITEFYFFLIYLNMVFQLFKETFVTMSLILQLFIFQLK